MSDTEKLLNIIDSMRRTRVLVIGDIMLDMYEHCEVRRISPEAPVPVATVIQSSCFLGGAGNVAHNVRALGAQVSLIGVVGDDVEGKMLFDLFTKCDIENVEVVVERLRPTTLKRRVLADAQHLLRIDREDIRKVSEITEEAILQKIKQNIPHVDTVIISDYCKGLMTDAVIEGIKSIATEYGKNIHVDSKNPRMYKYAGVHLMKPNKREAEELVGIRFSDNYSNLEDIGRELSAIFGSHVVVTLGADGMVLFEGGHFTHKKTRAQQVFDVSGAGDTVHATLGTAVAAGASLEDAVELANHAAGYVVGRLGTVVCGAKELKRSVSGQTV